MLWKSHVDPSTLFSSFPWLSRKARAIRMRVAWALSTARAGPWGCADAITLCMLLWQELCVSLWKGLVGPFFQFSICAHHQLDFP